MSGSLAKGLYVERRGAGAPLLLLNGMAADVDTWGESFLNALATDFEVIAFDQRGIGRSPRVSEPFTTAELADEAVHVLDGAGVERAHVAGFSLGGMVAQELALAHPERVGRLLLLATGAGGPGGGVRAGAVRELFEAMRSGDPDLAVATSLRLNTDERFAAAPGELDRWRAAVTHRPMSLAALRLQHDAGSAHDTRRRLHAITQPTLVLHGEADRMIDPDAARSLADGLGNARLQVLEGAGHLLHWQEPELIAELVTGHLGPRARSGAPDAVRVADAPRAADAAGAADSE